jgi:ATP-dependent RNA helicase DeaD
MSIKLFSELGLSPEILKAIEKLGFEKAAPIQAEAIPVLMSGRDVVGQSQTGSGKTAAFAIPAIEKTDPNLKAVQVLILCPTRELAVQVAEEFHKLTLFKRGITSLPIYGGQSYERQFWGLKQGAQIVIGTPGRVMDHMRRGTLRLETLKMVILDEADVMLNMGFREDIETILKDAPKERQTVFFSATMPRPIRDLIERFSRDPQNVKIEQKAMTVPTVEQVYYEVDRRFKVDLLTRLIDIYDLKLGIIFCNTKRMVDELVDHLEAQGYMADRLHGDMTQAQRDRVMGKFRKSGLEFLVATDIAARGIDVDDIQVVFNYDLPYDGEDYVHRIGRTGRAGRAGRAISFVAGRELFQIRNIERYTNTRIQRAKIPTVDEVHEVRASLFLDKLRATLTAGEYKKQDHLIERLLEEGFNSTDIASALIHHLQGGDATPAKPAPPEEPGFDRPERPPYRERRDDRGGRFEDRPAHNARSRDDDRRERAPYRDPRDERPAPRPYGAPASGPARAPRAIGTPISASASPRVPKTIIPPPKRIVKTFHAAPAAMPAPAPVAPPAAVKPAAAPASPKITEPKTFSDAEILASVKPETPAPEFSKSKPAPFYAKVAMPETASKKGKVKSERKTPADQTRLHLNVGEEMGVVPIDVVNSIAGETGLPGKVVGKVDIRERHSFVDVASEHANAILAKLNRAEIKGHKVKIKAA